MESKLNTLEEEIGKLRIRIKRVEIAVLGAVEIPEENLKG